VRSFAAAGQGRISSRRGNCARSCSPGQGRVLRRCDLGVLYRGAAWPRLRGAGGAEARRLDGDPALGLAPGALRLSRSPSKATPATTTRTPRRSPSTSAWHQRP